LSIKIAKFLKQEVFNTSTFKYIAASQTDGYFHDLRKIFNEKLGVPDV